MTTALENQREDQALGAAWRRCEAALPEANLDMELHFWRRIGYRVTTFGVETARYPTPTEALTALAEALEARAAE